MKKELIQLARTNFPEHLTDAIIERSKEYKEVIDAIPSYHIEKSLSMLNNFRGLLNNEPTLSSSVSAEEVFVKCKVCDGYGFTSEHNPFDPHIDGQCNSCPIQVQCESCQAQGYIPMHTYASQTREEEKQHYIKKDVAFDFIEWLEKGMWTNLEHRANGNITKTSLWYNTYRFEACEEPKTLDELYQEYLNRK